MALPAIEPLESLRELDRQLLHVFVIGPGQGEGIAVVLPGGGWILLDGCGAPGQRSRDPFPLELLKKRFGAEDELELLVLTHPHADHVHGFGDVIENLTPTRIAVTGVRNATDLRQSLAEEAAALQRRRESSNTGEAQVAARVLSALRAINTWAEDHPELLVALHDDVELVCTGSVQVTVRAPSETLLQGWFERGEMPTVMAGRANALSAVLEVRFGTTTVVLGGDLPVRDGQGQVPTGWDRVLSSHAHLVHHSALKVPHHGSQDALHSELIGPMPGLDRAWLLTPFNSSRLPRTDAEDGLETLLENQSPVMLTAPSASAKLLRAHRDGRVTPPELEHLTSAAKARSQPLFQAEDTVSTLDKRMAALAPVWGVAFSEKGCAKRWRGAAALEVHAEGDRNSTKPLGQ